MLVLRFSCCCRGFSSSTGQAAALGKQPSGSQFRLLFLQTYYSLWGPLSGRGFCTSPRLAFASFLRISSQSLLKLGAGESTVADRGCWRLGARTGASALASQGRMARGIRARAAQPDRPEGQVRVPVGMKWLLTLSTCQGFCRGQGAGGLLFQASCAEFCALRMLWCVAFFSAFFVAPRARLIPLGWSHVDASPAMLSR
jgi:hypothetical protein